MNIFVLSPSPREAAADHCDKHVVKMVLETAQLLSTAHHFCGSPPPADAPAALYKASHANHPCSVWVRETSSNYIWASELLEALLDEYTKRYGKLHATERLRLPLSVLPSRVRCDGLTPHPQCMPEELRIPQDPVSAYRGYYRRDKSRFAVWRYTGEPSWWL